MTLKRFSSILKFVISTCTDKKVLIQAHTCYWCTERYYEYQCDAGFNVTFVLNSF